MSWRLWGTRPRRGGSVVDTSLASGLCTGMDVDSKLIALLERAAGPPRSTGDLGDVRRRARRLIRRRRVAVAAAAVAVVLPGLLAVSRLQADDRPEVVALTPGAQSPAGDLLFERRLLDGSLLRVSSTDSPGEIAVELPGSTEPSIVPLAPHGFSMIFDDTQLAAFAMRACPADVTTSRLQVSHAANPAVADEMNLVDGLAVVAVPRLPEGEQYVMATRDVDGNLLTRMTIVAAPDPPLRGESWHPGDEWTPGGACDLASDPDRP